MLLPVCHLAAILYEKVNWTALATGALAVAAAVAVLAVLVRFFKDRRQNKVEGMAYLPEKPTPEAPPPIETAPEGPEKAGPDPAPATDGAVSERSGSPEPVPAADIPSFPSEDLNTPVPPELRITDEEQARLEALTEPPEAPEAPGSWDTEEGFTFDEEIVGGGSILWIGAIIQFFAMVVVTLIVLKIAVSITGVTAFFPGLIAIAFTDSLVRTGIGAAFREFGLPFGGPIQILVSFFVMLYLVKGFTSAREWPTIIKVVVMTKVVGIVLWWIVAMVILVGIGGLVSM
jgi:hypothetical protein